MLVLVCGGANAIADIGDKRTKRHFVIVVPNDVDSSNQDNIIDAANGDDIDRAMESSSVCNGNGADGSRVEDVECCLVDGVVVVEVERGWCMRVGWWLVACLDVGWLV